MKSETGETKKSAEKQLFVLKILKNLSKCQGKRTGLVHPWVGSEKTHLI
jgi:hypothetical protein